MRRYMSALVLGGAVILGGCSTTDEAPAPDIAQTETTTTGSPDQNGHHHHDTEGATIPETMVPADNPTYPVGSTVRLNTAHMEGMQGAEARIVGAYRTYAYAVDYIPTTGGEEVRDHKWVVQEEILDAGPDRIPDGTEVTLLADHMDGMERARATVVGSTDETVYVVDYDMDGMTMHNHMWVVESEIEPLS